MFHNRRGLLSLIVALSLWILDGRLSHPTAAFDSSPPDLQSADSRTYEEYTYRFTARIRDNGGITPFKVGEVIRGTFTYDPWGRDQHPDARQNGTFQSSRNALSFQFGDQYFYGTGDVLADVAVFKHAEHFGVIAPDLQLPKGWEMNHTRRSQSYGILFQNAPSKGIITKKGLPNRLSLKDFVNTRELRLAFFHGV